MSSPLFYVSEIDRPACVASALSLPEAFARVVTLAGYENWGFTRTARIMQLILLPYRHGDPEFESGLAVDRQAREDIMAQVCAHGLGRFRVTIGDPMQKERSLEHAA